MFFPPLLKTVFELVDFDAFLCFCHFFCFTSSPSEKHFSLRTFLHPGKQTQTSLLGRDWVNEVGVVEHGGHAVFSQKLNTQRSVGKCIRKSPIMKWANTLKNLQKNSLKLNIAFHNNASWYTDTDGFLECSLSWGKPVLQEACPPEDNSGLLLFLSPSSYICSLE